MVAHSLIEDLDTIECASCERQAAGDECARCGQWVCWDCSEDDQASGETLCPACAGLNNSSREIAWMKEAYNEHEHI